MNRPRRIALAIFLVVLGLAALRDLARLGDAFPWLQMHDFQDFYCAGEAVDRGANPYTYEPLHACEHRVNRTQLFTEHPALVIPAPQPPYDFPPFMALAKLPFEQARAVYAVAIVLAALIAAFALSRTGVPFDLCAVVLALPVAYLELDAGQIVPFAFLFLTLAGAALAARRHAWAGVCAALVTIEPHFGLSAALATLLFVPRARLALLLTAAFLAAVAAGIVGPATAASYAVRVLPAHALTEIGFPYQYSLTYALRFFGASPNVAQAAGDASFLVFLIAGLWIAPRLAARLRRPELLVFVPAATAAMAGPFLHMDELCFAIPAALVLAWTLQGLPRTLSAAALCVLTVPWIMAWAMKKLLLAAVFSCVYALVRLEIAPGGAVLTAVCIAAALYAFEFRSPSVPAPLAGAGRFDPNDLAQRAWRAFTGDLRITDPRWFAIKLPSWGALATLFGVALTASRGPQHEPANDAEPRNSEPSGP